MVSKNYISDAILEYLLAIFFFHTTVCFLDLMFIHVNIVHFFYVLYSVLLYKYAALYLDISLLINLLFHSCIHLTNIY